MNSTAMSTPFEVALVDEWARYYGKPRIVDPWSPGDALPADCIALVNVPGVPGAIDSTAWSDLEARWRRDLEELNRLGGDSAPLSERSGTHRAEVDLAAHRDAFSVPPSMRRRNGAQAEGFPQLLPTIRQALPTLWSWIQRAARAARR